MDYRVELDVYNGPLDLLLYLIKRDELDIYDIPIARITDSYIHYVNIMKEVGSPEGFDINLAGDFLVMAATLMEIKSAMLLPKPPPDPNAEASAAQELADPRYELVQKLLEYKRFKDSAFALERQQQLHQDRFPRIPARLEGEADEPPPIDLEEVQIWDIMEAFSRLMQQLGTRPARFHEVIYDDTPIDLHAADIEDRLNREGRLSFVQLLTGRKSRSEMIGVFLALLELIREKKILVIQGGNSPTSEEETGAVAVNEFAIVPAPEEHRRTYVHASLHLADETVEAQAEEVASAQEPIEQQQPEHQQEPSP